MKNIRLIRLIRPLFNAWFWLGIWLPYYLQFTDYAGVGVLEALMIFSMLVLEIPTGAVADLIGRKRTLLIGAFLLVFGNLIMGLAGNLAVLLVSMVMMTVGMALHSGTWEALIYDSLKQEKSEETYSRYYASVGKYSLLISAFSGIVGGYLWLVDNRLPFFATALAYLAGLIGILLLQEPKIDSEKFNLGNYLKQLKTGFDFFLKRARRIKFILVLLLMLGFFNIFIQLLDAALALDFGFKAEQLSWLFGILLLLSAFGSYLWQKFQARVAVKPFVAVLFFAYALTFLLAPAISPLICLLFLAGRNLFYPIVEIIASDEINRQVKSAERATTLSTFKMFTSLPYVLAAYWIGWLADEQGVMQVSLYLGVIFVALLLAGWAISMLLRSLGIKIHRFPVAQKGH